MFQISKSALIGKLFPIFNKIFTKLQIIPQISEIVPECGNFIAKTVKTIHEFKNCLLIF